MPLTHDDVKVLESKFAPNDHEFLRGYCYITEGGVTRRLDSVDPSWEFVIVNIAHRSDTITVTARLTVKGVTRENTGMQVIQSKDGKESGEPEKGATTDALKRCARLFGIGRYILDLPDTIKDNQSLARYLGGNTQQQSPKQDAPQSAPVVTPAPASAMKWHDNADIKKQVGTHLKEHGVQVASWNELIALYPVQKYATADAYIASILNPSVGANTPCIAPSKGEQLKTKAGKPYYKYTDDNNVSVSVFDEAVYSDINIMGVHNVMIFYKTNDKGYPEYVSHSEMPI